MSAMFFWLLLLHLESGVKKKNCSLLGSLVFPLETKTHIECLLFIITMIYYYYSKSDIILYCIKVHHCFLKYTLLKNIWLGLSGWQCFSNIYNY